MDMAMIDTTAEAGQVQIEILRKRTPGERLRSALDLAQLARALVEQGIRRRHPEYTGEQVRLALIRALLPEGLFRAAYPGSEDLRP